MPSITKEFLSELKEDYKDFPTFIETGTFVGETIFGIEKYFKELHTIEISEYYFNVTKNKYDIMSNTQERKINFHLGDSSKIFNNLLPKIKNNSIFWLDGHYSSGNTGQGEKDCPLYEELDCINNLFKHRSIIIIDDVRLFGTSYNEDWSDISIEGVVSKIKNRFNTIYMMPSELNKKDRLIIHIDQQ